MVSADFKSVGGSPSTGTVGSTPSRSRQILLFGLHTLHVDIVAMPSGRAIMSKKPVGN